MKKNMKRFTAMGVVAAMCAAMFTACGSKQNTAAPSTTESAAETAAAEGETYKVAIVKQLDHASLDEIANAIEAELDAIAKEEGITIEYELYSGQNDQSTLTQICDQVIEEDVDCIIPIATLAAQVATVSAEKTKTPVIYAAVSDPAAAELTEIDYVRGTSDGLNTEFIMDMIFAADPDADNIGLLYSLSEINSATPIEEAKAYLDAHNIAYTEQTANTNDEVVSAASSLIAEDVDAVFTPTDNVIMAAELAIYEDFAKAGIPHYAGADSFVRNGAFATCGVNYTQLGTDTGFLAYVAMHDGIEKLDKDFYLQDGGIITVNTETAEMLGIDYNVFKDMAELVTVQTSED